MTVRLFDKVALNSGLVLYLPLYDKTLGDGGKVLDRSKYHNNGIVSNAVWTSLGYDFDGDGDLITIADADSLTLSSGFTLQVWVNLDAGADGAIVVKDQNGQREFNLFLGSYLDFLAHDNTDGGYRGRRTSEATATALKGGGWKFLEVTYNGGVLCSDSAIYSNLVQIDETDYTSGTFTQIRNTTAPLTIGSAWATVFLEGVIGEVYLSSGVKTLTERQYRYLITKGRYGL